MRVGVGGGCYLQGVYKRGIRVGLGGAKEGGKKEDGLRVRIKDCTVQGRITNKSKRKEVGMWVCGVLGVWM